MFSPDPLSGAIFASPFNAVDPFTTTSPPQQHNRRVLAGWQPQLAPAACFEPHIEDIHGRERSCWAFHAVQLTGNHARVRRCT
ncbi:MAG: hypothetical protein JOZ62_03325 [Acidobacteriaceae bacterium]|nr:hypothetical protein [Acidobacteriaceae bacterium]